MDSTIGDPNVAAAHLGKELDRARALQAKLLGKESNERLVIRTSAGQAGMDATLRQLRSVVEDIHANNNTDFESYREELKKAGVATLSLPFITSESMVTRPLLDRFYDEFQHTFHFDVEGRSEEMKCCSKHPDPDENVFVSAKLSSLLMLGVSLPCCPSRTHGPSFRQHFRNFLAEMPKNAIKRGYEELSPKKTADELFGHLPPGSKVAVVSRFSKHERVRDYIEALQERNLTARIIQGQTGSQDFCFLHQTQQGLVALVKSTFAVWSGYLNSNNGTSRLYSVRSPRTQEMEDAEGKKMFRSINWTNPILKAKIRFELHNTEEMDEMLPTKDGVSESQSARS